jgi:Tfp pilus assembly protein PilO
MVTNSTDRQVHRQAALDKVAALLTVVKQLPTSTEATQMVELGEHLERAVQAFHLEAIRFRMYSLDRALNASAHQVPAQARPLFEEIRKELEAAGFATRSHSA